MVTQEKLQEHITKAKSNLAGAVEKAGGNKYDPDTRRLRKKYKRLTRKNDKIGYAKKKAAGKGKKKKEGS